MGVAEAVRAASRFSRRELRSSVFDFSTVERRNSAVAPEAMMLPVDRMSLRLGGDMVCDVCVCVCVLFVFFVLCVVVCFVLCVYSVSVLCVLCVL